MLHLQNDSLRKAISITKLIWQNLQLFANFPLQAGSWYATGLTNKIRGFLIRHEPVSTLEMHFVYTRAFHVVSAKALKKEYPVEKRLGLLVKIQLFPALLPCSDDQMIKAIVKY